MQARSGCQGAPELRQTVKLSPMLALSLQLAILASGLGAFIGGCVLIHPEGCAGLVGFRGVGSQPSSLRALGGALLLGHAATLATLAQSPSIGACLAAGLGAGWFGAAAGRGIGALVERRAAPDLLRIGFEALMGLVLWQPLWTYLRLIHQGRLAGST
jgi:hypothetical protein